MKLLFYAHFLWSVFIIFRNIVVIKLVLVLLDTNKASDVQITSYILILLCC